MAKSKSKLIEKKPIEGIYIDFVQSSKMKKEGGENTGALSFLAGLAGIGVFLDATGMALLTWVFFGDGITRAGGNLGKKFDTYRLKRIGKRELTLENMAGQQVTGRVDYVLALMALQNELMELEWDYRYSDHAQEKTELKERMDAIEDRINREEKHVQVEFGSAYKVITSTREIREYKLEDHFKAAKNPDKRLLKQAKKVKPPKPSR